MATTFFEEKNQIIEYCAQVAEKDGWHKAADAIRRLKDDKQPDPNLIYPGKDRDFVFPEE